MSARDKAALVDEIKNKVKPMCIDIADEQAEKIVRPLRNQFEDYVKKADEHREMIVETF